MPTPETVGVTALPIWRMLVVSFSRRPPSYFLTDFAGAELASGRLPEAGLVVAPLVALSAVGYLDRDAILAWIRANGEGPRGE